MTSFEMKLRIPAIAAALLCSIACVETDYTLGGSLVPVEQTYKIYSEEAPIPEMHMQMADSLSGYSSTRITIGAVRDENYGLSTRASAVTLVPLYDTLDFGSNPVVKSFHLSVAKDSTSVTSPRDENILQNVNVYALENPLDPLKNYDCNAEIAHGTTRICKGTPVINGTDSLCINFTEEYASQYLGITQSDLEDMDRYLKKFPGIYIDTDKPAGMGGRINMFELQLGYNSSDYYLTGNFASLTVNTKYDDWSKRKDTTFYFYLSPLDFYDVDSLLTNSSTGSFPQYGLNVTGHETRSRAGKAGDKVWIEGGGGLKPVIKARAIRDLAAEMISAKGADPKSVVINKATIVMPFEFPEDYTEMDRFPYLLSPTCRIISDDSATFMGLTDSSSSDENQGDIDRSNLCFSPDITYHMQEILKMSDEKIDSGNYDIWFLIMANETVTSSSSSSSTSDMSEYYQYLAYQSYYSSMYGGYSSSYGSSYSNYYTYMMLAQMYSSSGTTTSTEQALDRDRYYNAWLNGPSFDGRTPSLQLTFSVPNE